MIKITRFLSNKDKREMAKNGISIEKSDTAAIANVDGREILLINKRPLYFRLNEKWIPTLFNPLASEFPNVYVDMGAIRFVTNGADIMRPGIKEMNEFDKNALVVVRDVNHKKALALGIAMFSSNEISEMEKGKVIKNIHWVGDKIWEEGKSLIGNA